MISIAGASGSVGQLVAIELSHQGVGRLRLGGRKERALQSVAQTIPKAQVFPFDLTNDQEARAFCRGSDVVINCAGPSSIILDHLARAAIAEGVPYVDVAGDEPVYRKLVTGNMARSQTVMLSAGVLPGLSSLIPRWMAQGFDQVDTLSSFVGGLERCSKSSTIDMLLSMNPASGSSYGQPLAGWKNGRKVLHLLRPKSNCEIPFVPDPVNAYPFFSEESERLAIHLNLRDYSFWNIFSGEKLVETYIRYLGQDLSGKALDEAVDSLFLSSTLDLLGRRPYYMLVFQMEGVSKGIKATKTVSIRTQDAYRLIAVVASLAAQAILEGKAAYGLGFASEMINLDWIVSALRQSKSLSSFEMIEGSYDSPAIEEGAI